MSTGQKANQQQRVVKNLRSAKTAPAFDAALRQIARSIVKVHGGETDLIRMIDGMAHGRPAAARELAMFRKVSGYLTAELARMQTAATNFMEAR